MSEKEMTVEDMESGQLYKNEEVEIVLDSVKDTVLTIEYYIGDSESDYISVEKLNDGRYLVHMNPYLRERSIEILEDKDDAVQSFLEILNLELTSLDNMDLSTDQLGWNVKTNKLDLEITGTKTNVYRNESNALAHEI